MKKVIIIIFGIFVVSTTSKAQLPLVPGDAVVTVSGGGGHGVGQIVGTDYVLQVVKTNNTSTANLGATPPWSPTLYSHPDWDVNSLGTVFGITLDIEPNPNIYVSSTQIYRHNFPNERRIWRIDGTTGNKSLVYDFNPSGQTTEYSLGNLKYAKIGGTDNIYVSDFQTGEIQRLTGDPSNSQPWSQNSFQPFGNEFPNFVPYGLAVRRSLTGYKLYYAKVRRNADVNDFYGTEEIYSVDLTPSGDFDGNEGLVPVDFSTLDLFANPISDIDFSDDGNRMVIAQQTWTRSGTSSWQGDFAWLWAHSSEIVEFVYDGANWIPSGLDFPSGDHPEGIGTNSVGGVCYSNNNFINQNNNNQGIEQYGCNPMVWFTSDAIQLMHNNSSSGVYGMQGMPLNSGNNYVNAINIDLDNNVDPGFADKFCQGDVEIYNLPCKSDCGCGEWQSVNINGTLYDGNPPILPTLSFDKNNPTTGFILSNYACSAKECDATYAYTLLNQATNQTLTFSSDNNRFDFRSFGKWDCGDYSFCIVPSCDGAACDTLCLDVKIVCNPCPECESTSGIKQTKKGVKAASTDQGENASVLSSMFDISNSIPVSQVRVMVDEIRVTSENKNCMVCKNAPITWGNILYGSLDGFPSSGGNNTVNKDQREIVFGAGTNLFDITNGANLKLNLGLPLTTGLECCETTAEICIKVTIRDINCCEREVLQCFSVTY